MPFKKIFLGSTNIGQAVGFSLNSIGSFTDLQKLWTKAYGVKTYRRDPFPLLQGKDVSHRPVNKRIESHDVVAWLAANSPSFNKDFRDPKMTSPTFMLVMKGSGAIIFSFKEKEEKESKKAHAYPIPPGTIKMVMPAEKVAKLEGKDKFILSPKQLHDFMTEIEGRMKKGESGWAC